MLPNVSISDRYDTNCLFRVETQQNEFFVEKARFMECFSSIFTPWMAQLNGQERPEIKGLKENLQTALNEKYDLCVYDYSLLTLSL